MEKNTSGKLEKLYALPVWKAVLTNSIPAMISMTMMLIYNIADLFFVGQTGDPLQVAAVSLATPIFLFFMAFGNVFGVGGTSVCSRSFGSGNIDVVKKTSAFCILSSAGIGIIVSVLVFFNGDIVVQMLGASSEVSEMVYSYIQIISFSGAFIMISGCMSHLLRSEGRAKEAMMGMMLGNIVNIILDPIFILTLEMGVIGAAIATMIGNMSAGTYYIIYLLKGNSLLNAKIKNYSLEKDMVKKVLSIGIPASMATMLMSVSQIVLNSQMTQYGDMAVAGIGIATKVSMMTSMLFIGLGQGVQPLLGYCIGAKNELRYKSIIKFSLIFAFGLSAFLTIFCYIGLEEIVGAFLTHPQAFDYAYSFSEIRLTTSFLFGMYFVLLNALQAAGAVKSSLTVNVSRQGLIFIPAVFILGGIFGELGLILAQPVADILSFILVVTLYLNASKNMFSKKSMSDS